VPARRDGLSFAARQPPAMRVAIAALLAALILAVSLGPALMIVAVLALAIVIAVIGCLVGAAISWFLIPVEAGSKAGWSKPHLTLP